MRAKRLDAVQNRINRFPYRYEAIDNAYARFLHDGTLPEDLALSWRDLKRVLKARKPVPELPQEQLDHAITPRTARSGNRAARRARCCSTKRAAASRRRATSLGFSSGRW